MAKQRNKEKLLSDIQVERKRLESNLVNLTEMDMTRQGVVGEWSVKDVLAHLAAWEQLFISWYESGLQGRIPEAIPVGMSEKAIDALYRKNFLQYRRWSLNDVWTEFHSSYHQVLAVAQSILEEDLFTPGRYAWTGKFALVDYVAGNTCNHYRWAKAQIRRWLKTQDRL